MDHRLPRGLDEVHVAFGALVLAGVGLAVVVAWRPAASFPNGDALVFVESARRLSKVGTRAAEYGRHDPVLRYAPLALVYLVLPDLPAGLASHVGSLHAGLFAFVLVPASIYLLGAAVFDRRSGLGAMLVALALHASPEMYPGFYTGQWQDLVVLPLCYVGLALLWRYRTRFAERPWRPAVAVGAFLALAALTQLMAAFLLGAVVLVTLLAWEEYRAAIATAGVAAVGATPLLLHPGLERYLVMWFEGHVLTGPVRRALSTNQPLVATLLSPFSMEYAVARLLRPTVLLTLLLLAGILVLARYRMPDTDSRRYLESVFLLAVGMYLFWKLSRFEYVGTRIRVFFAPLAGSLIGAWVAHYRGVVETLVRPAPE